jgi:hypothetical protein
MRLMTTKNPRRPIFDVRNGKYSVLNGYLSMSEPYQHSGEQNVVGLLASTHTIITKAPSSLCIPK